jgi:hypothetical protein
MKKERCIFYLDEDRYIQIQRLAKKNGYTISHLLREIVERFLRNDNG